MSDINHPLIRLWMSSAQFLERFNQYPPNREAQRRVFNEEAYEFLSKSVSCQLMDALKLDEKQELVSEAADVIVTVMTTLMAHGVQYKELEVAIEKIAQKNDSKTHESHEVNSAGKIARKKST